MYISRMAGIISQTTQCISCMVMLVYRLVNRLLFLFGFLLCIVVMFVVSLLLFVLWLCWLVV